MKSKKPTKCECGYEHGVDGVCFSEECRTYGRCSQNCITQRSTPDFSEYFGMEKVKTATGDWIHSRPNRYKTKRVGYVNVGNVPLPTDSGVITFVSSDGDKMSPVEYENNLPQKIRIDRVVDGYGKLWDGRYEMKVIYHDKGKVKEGIIPDDVVEYLVSQIREYKK